VRTPELQEVIDAWSALEAGLDQEESDDRILGYVSMLRAIAEHGAASLDGLATTTGRSRERIGDFVRGLAAAGFEVDAEGNVVGAALTVTPTPHCFRVKGRDLFAWCALDSLFLPGLLDETAEVASSCPSSGEEIRLTVSPGGVEAYSPATAVLTVVIPQKLAAAGGTGPASPT